MPAEFGQSFPQSPEALRRVLAEVREGASTELSGIASLVLQRAHLHWIELELQMKWCDQRIEPHARSDYRARKAAALQGIGPRPQLVAEWQHLPCPERVNYLVARAVVGRDFATPPFCLRG